MRIVQFTLFVSAICGIAPASSFVPPSSHHDHSRPSSTSLDAIDPTILVSAAGAAVAAIGVAFGMRSANGSSADVASPGVKKQSSAKPTKIDVSIPYDAASILAYDSYVKTYGKKANLQNFQTLYNEQMVAEVKAKVQERKIEEMKAVLESMESDAADIKGQIVALFDPSAASFSAKKVEAPPPPPAAAPSPPAPAPVPPVAAASKVDLTIEYDGAAKLAYEKSDKSMAYDAFRQKYEAETVAMVTAKKAARDAA